MDKDIKEILKRMEKIATLLKDKDIASLSKEADELFEKAIKEPCKISIKKDGNGKAEVQVQGTRLAVLIALAGLKEAVLNNTNCTEDEFDFIQNRIGTKEVKNNE